MRLRTRIVLSLVLLALLVASAALVAALTHQRLHAQLDEVGTVERQSRAALELSLAVRDLYAHQAHSIILGNDSHLGHYRDARTATRVLLDVLSGVATAPEDQRVIGGVAASIRELEDNFERFIVPGLGGPAAALVRPHDRALALVESVTAAIDGMTLRFRQRADLAQRAADASHEAEIFIHLGLVLAAAAFALVIALYLWRASARPLGDLQRGAERLARGDLSARIAVPADRDLAILAGTFNSMAQDLERHARQLIEAEKLASVGRIAAGIAHEINNPLAVIIGHARLLERSADAIVADDARRVALEAERCREIVQGLLDLARPTRLAYGEVDLDELGRDVADQLVTIGVPCRVTVLPHGASAAVAADAKKVRQIFWNLMRNAAEAAPDQPIDLAFRRDGPLLRVSFTDRGPGIAPGVDLFEPFQTSKPGGTGLGLAVSRALARAHGGDLVLLKTAPTTFELSLPTAPAAPAAMSARGGPA